MSCIPRPDRNTLRKSFSGRASSRGDPVCLLNNRYSACGFTHQYLRTSHLPGSAKEFAWVFPSEQDGQRCVIRATAFLYDTSPQENHLSRGGARMGVESVTLSGEQAEKSKEETGSALCQSPALCPCCLWLSHKIRYPVLHLPPPYLAMCPIIRRLLLFSILIW